MTTETKLNIVAWVILIAGLLYGLHWKLVGLAWASVFTIIFFNSSLAIVAGRELKGTPLAPARAISPALILNIQLFAALWLADAIFLRPYAQGFPGLYVLLMTCIGGAVYVTAFLFLPIKSLETESANWRTKLRLSNQ